MSSPDDAKQSTDPFEAWRQVRDASLEAWAKTMTEAVNSDAYAKASGAMLDGALTASIPFRQMLEKAMLQALEQLSMPSRADIISLAERLTHIEMRLDDLDAKIDLLLTPRTAAAGDGTEKP